jgi:site-specific DNA-cytosine methylase
LTPLLSREFVFNAFMVACGVGIGARGFADAVGTYKRLTGRFEVIGGVDVDPVAIRAFERLVRTPGTVLDLFTRDQYRRFHGHEPPDGWREATGEDFRRAARGRRPNVVFSSSPCKGLSALLNNAAAETEKYQALNELVSRSIDLIMEAWGDDPPEFILIENVPRILTRGRPILDEVKQLDLHGYASVETVHDCGELGGLAQHRQRFLLVARHRAKVRPHLWEPPKKRVRGVGEVIGALPLPGPAPKGKRGRGISSAEAMHRVPNLKWLTWLRLALIEAGSDWRSLERLAVRDGYLRDVGVVPVGADWHNGVLGVRDWNQPSGTVTGESLPFNGSFGVADPRVARTYAARHDADELRSHNTLGILGWNEPAPTITGEAAHGAGRFSVADPRATGPRA